MDECVNEGNRLGAGHVDEPVALRLQLGTRVHPGLRQRSLQLPLLGRAQPHTAHIVERRPHELLVAALGQRPKLQQLVV